MARPKKPVDVILADGNKAHLTKSQIARRKEEEIEVPFTDIVAPDFLLKSEKKEFDKYAKMLEAVGIFTELDVDTLARYVQSQTLYISYTRKLRNAKDIDAVKTLQLVQDRAFKQAHTCAMALGLTITARCKLVVPKVDNDDESIF